MTLTNGTEYINVGTARLRCDLRGPDANTVPLVLLSGIGASLELLDPLRNHIDGRKTVGIDLPGTGQSTTSWRPQSMLELGLLVTRALTRLGVERFDLLGVSWGGVLAQATALSHPRRVRRLVLAATAPGAMAIPGDPTVWPMMLSIRRYTSSAYLRKVAPRLYGGAIRSNPDLLSAQARLRQHNPPSPVGYAWQLFASATWTNLPFLQLLRQRTLVLAGDDDPIINVLNARSLVRCVPHARLEIIEGGGHLFLITNPQRHARTIESFLDASDNELEEPQ